MAGNLVKRVMLKIVADDGDSEAKLDKITARADELGRKHPEIKVRIDAAAASAKIHVLREEMKHLEGQTVTMRARLMALGGAATGVIGLGDAFTLFSKDASMGAKVMSGFSLATGLLEPAMSGLIVGVGGLATGLTAAGIGAAAFGVVAKSAISQVTPAVQAYEQALSTSGKAAMTAMTTYRQDLAALTPQQREMTRAIIGAEGAWQKFVNSNTSGVSKILSQGIGLLPRLLSTIQPMLAPVEHALSGVIHMISTSMKSSGFIEFFAGVDAYAGPSISKLAVAIKNVIGGIGGILQAFMPASQTILSGLDRITGKFEHWGQTLTSHSGFQSLMSMAKQDMPYVIGIVKNLAGAFVHLGGSMTGLSTFANSKLLLQLALPLSQLVSYLSKANPALLRMGLYALAAGGGIKKMVPAFQGIKSGIDGVKGGVTAFKNLKGGFQDAETAASDASGAWGTFGGSVSKAVTAIKGWGIWSKIAAGATKVWTGVQAAFDVVMDANPIALVVIGIAALIAIIVVCVVKFKAFRDFWIDLWKDVVHIADTAFDWVKSHFRLLATVLLAITTGGLGLVVLEVVRHFTQIRSGAVRLVHDVTSFFASLPGRILSVLASLPGKLFSFGGHIISMLASGIRSAIGDVTGAIGSVAGEVLAHIPMSPAKKGPLSGRGSPDLAGRRIGLMLAAGIRSTPPVVAAAAAQVAGAAAVHGGGYRPGGAGAGGEIVLRIEGSDSSVVKALVLALRREIRVQGGNVQTVLGH